MLVCARRAPQGQMSHEAVTAVTAGDAQLCLVFLAHRDLLEKRHVFFQLAVAVRDALLGKVLV